MRSPEPSGVEVFVKDRELVVPGQPLARGPIRPQRNVYKDKMGITRATRVGLVEIGGGRVGLIPLRGVYVPKIGDLVIGKVEGISPRIVLLDISSFHRGVMLMPKKTRGRRMVFPSTPKYEELKPGDVVLAKVRSSDGASDPLLTIRGEGLGKLRSGYLMEIEASKVPRALGKRHSMLSLIKERLKCDLVIGQNGIVWVGTDDPRVIGVLERALRKIEKESHVAGLTERIGKLLDSFEARPSK